MVLRFLSFFLALSCFLMGDDGEEHEKPDIPSLVNLTALPSSIVNNSVNVISGDYLEHDVDYVVSGPDPYVLGHIYCSSSLEEGTLSNGWNFHHHYFLQVYQPDEVNFAATDPHKHSLHKNRKGQCVHGVDSAEDRAKNDFTYLYLVEPSGSRLLFEGDGWAHNFHLVTKKTGYTNVCQGELSGRTNIKNIRVKWHCTSDRWHVRYGDGTRRVYARTHKPLHKRRLYQDHYRDYHLRLEKLPSGNVRHYHYTSEDEVSSIFTTDHTGTRILNILQFTYKSDQVLVQTSDKQAFRFYLKKLKDDTYAVSGIKRPGRPFVRFSYSDKSPRHERRVVRKESDDGYFLNTKYYRPTNNQVGSDEIELKNKKRRRFFRDRVRLQEAPVGPGGETVITHRYFYHKDKKYRSGWVKDAYDNITHYCWDKNKRLKTVTKYDPEWHQLMQERYVWGSGKQKGFLKVRTLFDENKKPVLSRQFHYDKRGNVIQEDLYGRCTENSGHLELNKFGYPHHSSCDKITTKRSFSSDGFNLLLSEEDADGNFTYYEYYKRRNLLKAKFVCDKKKIKKREFFSYTSYASLSEKIIDDGVTKDKDDLTGVSERHITLYRARNKRPSYGMPRVIEEYAVDLSRNEKVLQKVLQSTLINTYSDNGFITRCRLFDANGSLSSSTEYTHDKVGRILSSTDILNRKTFFTYDEVGRLLTEKSARLRTSYTYDLMGNVLEKKESEKGGITLTTRFRYDLLGRKIAHIDPQGNETTYAYDSLSRITKITYPKICGLQTDLQEKKSPYVDPEKRFRYEKLGTVIYEIDENDYVTITKLNAFGAIISCSFPDKTELKRTYDLKGNCIKEVACTGTETHMTYDAFGRMTSSQILGDKKVFTYNSFHQIEEIAPTGERVQFIFDYAGRVREKRLGPQVQTFTYDALGRLITETVGEVVKRFEYDKANRLIKEAVTDLAGTTFSRKLFGYDRDDNLTHEMLFIDGKEATNTTYYDAFKRIKERIDAEGNRWLYVYDDFTPNRHHQTVIKKTTIHPTGVFEEELYDTHGKLSIATRHAPHGEVIAKKELFYNPAHMIVYTKEYALDTSDRIVTTAYSYGPNNRLESIQEAVGTPEEKKTRYTYNCFGQKEKIINADGTTITHAYDAKGRLKRYNGHAFDYEYRYDGSDRILEAKNALSGKATLRTYDALGHLSSETLESGLKTSYTYDMRGRISTLTLPDTSQVTYSYSPVFLESITHADWTYEVLSRDLAGNILSAKLPAHAGTVEKRYDKKNRCVAITHPLFEERRNAFDAVGNLLDASVKDPLGESHNSYTYDRLYQLIQENGYSPAQYRYDALHNRVAHNDAQYTINSLHAVLHDGKREFAYDKRGNRTSAQGITCSYDGLNRLISVETETKFVTYSYDAFNRRIEKRSDTSERYLFVDQNEIGAADESGKIFQLRILGEGLGAEIGAACAIELDSELYIPLHDARGNVTALLDQEGTLVESYRYDAFGIEITSSTRNPWRFSSKRVDPETGFVFFGMRYYDPTIGKWLTQDPLGLQAGPNLYAYLLNNPMTRYDLYGLLDDEVQDERDFGEKIRDGIVDAARTVRDIACRIGETLIHHMPHFGSLNNSIEDSLRSLRGADPMQRQPSGEYPVGVPYGQYYISPQHGLRLGPVCKSRDVYNGILCSFSAAMKNAQKVVYKFGFNAPVRLCYTESKGLCTDLFDTLQNLLHIKTSNIDALSKVCQDRVDDCRQGQYVEIYAHSRGGITAYLAMDDISQKDKRKFDITTFGTTHIFSTEEGFRGARNLVGRSDWTTWLTHFCGIISDCFSGRGEVTFVGSFLQFPFSNHSFLSNDYFGRESAE